MGTSRTRIAIIDERIPIQIPGQFNRLLQTVVIGCSATLTVNLATPQLDMTNWITANATSLGHPLKLDLICHGQAFTTAGSASWVLQLGTTLHINNVERWHPIDGLVDRIRVYACGARDDHFSSIASGNFTSSQHQLMAELAFQTSAEVKYSLLSAIGLGDILGDHNTWVSDPLQESYIVDQFRHRRRG
jgi:hypothetical protein